MKRELWVLFVFPWLAYAASPIESSPSASQNIENISQQLNAPQASNETPLDASERSQKPAMLESPSKALAESIRQKQVSSECSRKLFLQTRVIEQQRRKIQELQNALSKAQAKLTPKQGTPEKAAKAETNQTAIVPVTESP
jgi:hypothetical protein